MKAILQKLRTRPLAEDDYLTALNREIVPVVSALRETVNAMAAAPETVVSTATAPDVHYETMRFASVMLTSNARIDLFAPDGADLVILRVIQDSTGGWTPPWGTGILWSSGTPPTLSLAPGAVDIFIFYTDGTSFYGAAFGFDYQ